jgi:hypothetical protein
MSARPPSWMRLGHIDSLLAALVLWTSSLLGAMMVLLWFDEGLGLHLSQRMCESVTTCIALRDYRSQVRLRTSHEMWTNTKPPREPEECPGRQR